MAANKWKLPNLDTTYKTEDGHDVTLRQMLDGLDPEIVPANQDMLHDLLCAYGAWESLEGMEFALENRVYEKGIDGKIGFKLV